MTTYYRAHEPQHPPRLLHSLPRRHETTKKAMIFVRSWLHFWWVHCVGCVRVLFLRHAPSSCKLDTMKIHIAHSPDSDDAFMFYGLASGKVPADGFELEHVLSDIETLNRAAFDGAYEITAVSFHAYAHLTDRYILLPHGASMGERYGPIVVSKKDGPSSLKGIRVAIPGELTTAFLTLRLYDPTVEY